MLVSISFVLSCSVFSCWLQLLILFLPLHEKMVYVHCSERLTPSHEEIIFSPVHLLGHMVVYVHTAAFKHVIACDHKNAASSKISSMMLKNSLCGQIGIE